MPKLNEETAAKLAGITKRIAEINQLATEVAEEGIEVIFLARPDPDLMREGIDSYRIEDVKFSLTLNAVMEPGE